MKELVASVKEHGVLQPILVRPWPEGVPNPDNKKYQLIAGERRWRAASTAKLSTIPAVVRAVSDAQAAELAIVENVTRQDVSLAEFAFGCYQLVTKFGLNEKQVARRINKGEAVVDGLLKLAHLPTDVQEMFAQKKAGEWTLSHVHEFWKLRDYPDVLSLTAAKVAKEQIPASKVSGSMSRSSGTGMTCCAWPDRFIWGRPRHWR